MPKRNLANLYTVVAIYVAVIIFSGVYLFLWQGFGSQGLTFSIAGRDHVFDAFDIVLLAATIMAVFLVALALLAFRKKRDLRLFVLALAFFFFALVQILQLFDNFFPNEYIFINNAIKVLNLLILLSFVMLIFPRPRK